MTFQELGLIEPLLRAVAAEGYTTPTSIQQQAIGAVMSGCDLLGCAQTGTGKTAAFALPILQRLAESRPNQSNPSDSHGGRRGIGHNKRCRAIRSLIVAPTRELASQIADSFRTYGKHLPLRSIAIFGGVGQFPQVKALRDGVDILIATPGRLLDLINQGHIDLGSVEVLVLDEADQMLDMGFLPDIRKIVSRVPQKRQTLMFSATMPRDIRVLADSILNRPREISVNPQTKTADNIAQSVYYVARKSKPTLLHHLMQGQCIGRTLVFTRTKHGADRVVKALVRDGIDAAAIHGNKSQNARTKALDRFKRPNPPVLVATDIASRGIDVDDVTHVINYDLPNTPEAYVHRIGRTARAGASGEAVSFCDADERSMLRSIERLTGTKLSVVKNLPEMADVIEVESSERTDRHEKRSSHASRRGGQSRPSKHSRAKSSSNGSGRKPSSRRRSSQGDNAIGEAPKRMERSARAGERRSGSKSSSGRATGGQRPAGKSGTSHRSPAARRSTPRGQSRR